MTTWPIRSKIIASIVTCRTCPIEILPLAVDSIIDGTYHAVKCANQVPRLIDKGSLLNIVAFKQFIDIQVIHQDVLIKLWLSLQIHIVIIYHVEGLAVTMTLAVYEFWIWLLVMILLLQRHLVIDLNLRLVICLLCMHLLRLLYESIRFSSNIMSLNRRWCKVTSSSKWLNFFSLNL